MPAEQCPTCKESVKIVRSVHELPTGDVIQALCQNCGTGFESKVQPAQVVVKKPSEKAAEK